MGIDWVSDLQCEEFWRWMVVTAAQLSERTRKHGYDGYVYVTCILTH